MISEPEMAGEPGAYADRETLDLAGRPPAEERGPRPPRPWARWRWALGGAVAASALWGTALFALAPGDRMPDLHGYGLDEDPCATVRLKSLSAALGPREPAAATESGVLRHAALDRSQCFISLRQETGPQEEEKGWSLQYAVGLTVALHKETDPRVEFEAGRNATELGVDPETRVEMVPDLGDKAYLLSLVNGESELRVLEGGAVLSLRLMVSSLYRDEGREDGQAEHGDEEEPDTAPYRPAMISDMRDLMELLKR
ncbi:hypothetical protein ABZ454_10460 [Streptomyces sp. NPDC005803]|uniref:hypothetical protein n=1 Tax=Streptomyces sp. NPDC005803 TaxID=3154297 RepID=UPI0033F9F1F4